MKRAEQLKSLKMPKQKMAEDEAALDLDMIGSEEPMPEGEEGAEKPEGEMPEVAPASEMLADLSDEELLAELKKRGLIEGDESPAEEKAEEEMA